MRLQTSHKKILITGANGQLGNALKAVSLDFTEYDYIFASKMMVDITSENAIKEAIQTYQPDIIINTAAYTAVDAAETNEEEAYLLNEKAVHSLATLCANHKITLIHISTDYVFDGNSSIPYTETSTPNPQTVYGKSKLAGEIAIQGIENLTYAIVRTSWLYSDYGHNFYKTMLRLGIERSNISVVNDQHGIPTFANDLARAILRLIPQLDDVSKGVYHYSNTGITTWYAFAKAIFKYSKLDVKVMPVSSKEYPTAAKRPKYSILDCTKIKKTFEVYCPFWEEALKK
ncbi:dTDP-4-dehydrorhamnose reductase [uncultured Dokdonia sp.]|uniref:dTDP-4-dehydrorhamnose reductase n=1 Tax=uncultured Dokdonia sp. TaxID=575653 RepID=UPI002629D787|nr:dTDP-4-dehydrorhamnose reductase [uncultured Dokdonia sp.]